MERAPEVAANILNVILPDNYGSMSDLSDLVDLPGGQSQDVRWMETVIFYQ